MQKADETNIQVKLSYWCDYLAVLFFLYTIKIW